MLKFLRKYNLLILAVFGTLLMIVFLVPEAIQQLGRPQDGRVVVRYEGGKLRQAHAQQARQELGVINRIMPVFGQLLGMSTEGTEDWAHWYLLVREAERGGFVGGPGEGQLLAEAIIDSVARQEGMSHAEVANFLDRVAYDQGLSRQGMHTALSRAHGVQRMVQAYLSAARVSDRRASVQAGRLGEYAVVNAVVLGPELMLDEAPEPELQDLVGHFARYREVEPGEGEYGFGYVQPDRVKLATMTLDREEVISAVRPGRVAVARRWEENRDRFPGELSEERSAVEREIAEEVAEDVFRVAHQVMQGAVYGATRGLETEGPHFILPEDWPERRPDFEELAGAVVEGVEEAFGDEVQIRMPRPRVELREGEWLTRRQLQTMNEFAGLRVRVGPREAGLAEVVFSLREFDAPGPVVIQAGVPPVDLFARDRRGNRVYSMVTDAQRSAPPETVEEVIDRVREDWQRQRAFELLRERSEELESAAASGGLELVVDLFAAKYAADDSPEGPRAPRIRRALRVRPLYIEPFAPELDTDGFRDAVLEAARGLDPMTPLEEVDPREASLAVALPRELSVAVTRIVARRPLTEESIRREGDMWISMLVQEELEEAVGSEDVRLTPYLFPRLASRWNWRFVGEEAEARGLDQETGEPLPGS